MELQMHGEPVVGETRYVEPQAGDVVVDDISGRAKQEMEAQIGLYRSMMYVGGRGHGKVAMQHAAIEEQRRRAGELMEQASTSEWARAMSIKLEPWQKVMFRNMMGSWRYTPADELRNRLNDRLQGKEPVAVINTRYWRNL